MLHMHTHFKPDYQTALDCFQKHAMLDSVLLNSTAGVLAAPLYKVRSET